MIISKTVPKSGHFVGLWVSDGILWSENLRQVEGGLEYYSESREDWMPAPYIPDRAVFATNVLGTLPTDPDDFSNAVESPRNFNRAPVEPHA